MILTVSFVYASSSMRLTISMLSVLLQSSKQLFLFLPETVWRHSVYPYAVFQRHGNMRDWEVSDSLSFPNPTCS